MTDARKILIQLTDNELIVANTGTPFSREAVISVCTAHLSSKTNKIYDNYNQNSLEPL